MTDTVGTVWLDGLIDHKEIAAFAGQASQQLQKQIKPGLKLELPHLLIHEIEARLPDHLHIDVLSFLAQGWNSALELEDCRKKSRDAPGSTVVAKLGRHSIGRDLKPNIEVSYGVRKSFEINAAIVVEGVFDGVEVAFEDGQVASVGSGHCELTLQLKVADKPIGRPHTVKSWALPGRYPLSKAQE
jgi:hypothetical protein